MGNTSRRYFISLRNSLATNDTSLSKIVSDVNELIQERGGIILRDGQILTTQISESNDLVRQLNEEEVAHTPKREWNDSHREYFGILNPYQEHEADGEYGESWICVDIDEPYLKESERILALLDGSSDGRPFYCTCHEAQVVYTSERRLVCMACGALHCVLEEPLSLHFETSMSEEEWLDLFGYDGTKKEDEVSVDILDFCDVEHAPKLWITDRWEEASRELTFFARSTPEEFEKYRGSIITPGLLIEAGFSHIPEPPPPIFQIEGSEHDVDIFNNAFGSFEEGVLAYQNGKTQVGQLKFAILQLFHSIELLLKICLNQKDPNALTKNPNNPTVLKLLNKKGVILTEDELRHINSLRKLRNSLQHDEAKFNYRSALSLSRNIMIFVDRFSLGELNIWLADAIDSDAWQVLLELPSIKANAERLSIEVIQQIKEGGEHNISACPRCKRETLVSAFMQGSFCIYCRHRPTVKELFPDEFEDD